MMSIPRLSTAPRLALVPALECRVRCPVGEPFVVFLETPQRMAMRCAAMLGEMQPRLAQQLPFEGGGFVVVDGVAAKLRNLVQRAVRQKAIAQQAIGRNEQRIPGIRRVTSVRRVAVARRIERQDLPESESRALGPIEEHVQLVAEVADAITARQ